MSYEFTRHLLFSPKLKAYELIIAEELESLKTHELASPRTNELRNFLVYSLLHIGCYQLITLTVDVDDFDVFIVLQMLTQFRDIHVH